MPLAALHVAVLPSFELIENSIEGYLYDCNFAGAFTRNKLLVSPVVPLCAGQVGFVKTPSLASMLAVIFEPELKMA